MGHDVGDLVLGHLAKVLKSVVNPATRSYVTAETSS